MRRFLVCQFALVTAAVCVLAAARAMSAQVDGPDVIRACVNPSSGEIKILKPGVSCGDDRALLTWSQTGPQGPMGPAGPAGASGIAQTQYITGGMYPDTSVARAFCPLGTKVVGGGGITLNGAGLQQNYPISDETGLIAWGKTAIGWQVAAHDWSDVQAFVVCAM